MSNKRITDLTELTTPTTDDVFPVVDIATNTTTKVQLANLPVQTAVTTALATKQNTLVSGVTIKTVNSTSLLGSGDIPIPIVTPSGVSGAIQFSNGSAFASDAANFFWDDTNNRLGIGTNTPTDPLSVTGTSFFTQSTGNPTLTVKNTGNGAFNAVLDIFERTNGNLYFGGQGLIVKGLDSTFGGTTTSLGARVGIKGSGSTSATTSLLVQNSSGASSLQVKDDGSVFNYGKGAITGNTAFGDGALTNNTTGNFNSAHGIFALQFNTIGTENCAVGAYTLFQNTSGIRNTAIGQNALSNITTGSRNTAIGYNARVGNFSESVVIGCDATATASNQFVVGSSTTNAGSIDSSAFTQDKRWKVKINGVDYYIALQTA